MQRYKTEYDAQAGEFMRKWGVKIHRHFVGKMRHFPDDREPRNVWEITLERDDGRSFSFRYGDSIVNTQGFPRHKPSDYGILADVSAKSCFDCKNVRDMVEEYGYDAPTNRREFDKLHQIWVNSSEHGRKLRELFADCLDELQEVQ